MADTRATENNNKKCKLVVLGDTGVGKTSLIVRFVRDAFRRFEATAGGTYYKKNIELEDSTTTINFNIWDTCGIERYRSVQCIFLPGALVAVVVYDVTNDSSLAGAKYWVEDLQDRYKNTMIVLAGNKVDLGLGTTTPTFIEAERYAREREIVHLGTSAKTSRNVETLFRDIARTLYESEHEEEEEETVVTLAVKEDGDDEAAAATTTTTTTTTTTMMTTSQRLASVLCCSKPKPTTRADAEESTEVEEDDDADGDESTTNTTPLLSAANEREADTSSSTNSSTSTTITTSSTFTTTTQRWASSLLFCFKRKNNPSGQSIQVAQ